MTRTRILASALAALIALTTAALAGAAAYDEVYDDFDRDGRITPCYFSATTLQEALGQIPGDTDAYNPDFREAINAALSRVNSGRCGAPPGQPARLRIKSLRAKSAGSPRGEVVTIVNAGDARVKLKGWAVSNPQKRFYTFARGSLAPKKTIRLRSQQGRNQGSTFYWRATRQLWPDSGGTAKLWAPGRRLAQKFTYGSFR